MRFLTSILILSLLPAAAAAEVQFGESQGRFSVFGPSAEREAFFAEQVEAREAELEAQRQERNRALERQAELERLEVLREIAEADARARATQAENRNILVNCVITNPGDDQPPARSLPFPGGPREIRVSRSMPPLKPGPGRPGPFPDPTGKPESPRQVVNCLPTGLIGRPYRPYGTQLSISVNRGRVSGSLSLRSPPVGMGFGF